MEPYRGFPQAMTAFAEVQRRRPGGHVVVVGADRVAYGGKLPDGDTYKQKMLRELDLDPQRLHFTGVLSRDRYRDVLLASSVHVYLTVPFVLSWSLIEALAAGCAVVASDTAPVREVLRDGENGLLVDFFDAGRIAGRICEVLQRAADGDEGLARVRAPRVRVGRRTLRVEEARAAARAVARGGGDRAAERLTAPGRPARRESPRSRVDLGAPRRDRAGRRTREGRCPLTAIRERCSRRPPSLEYNCAQGRLTSSESGLYARCPPFRRMEHP